MKDAVDIGTTSLGIGVMSGVVSGAGGNAAPLQTISSFMPSIGAAAGGKALLKKVKKIGGK